MNMPGTSKGNWRWQLRPGQLTVRHAARLRELTDRHRRLPG
jgi:4-alpha-glucanotransferase